MKRIVFAVAALLMGAALYNASAAVSLVTVDENGNGNQDGNALPWGMWNPDPSPVANWVPQPWTFPDNNRTPWNGSVLVYQLPFLPTAGDVIMIEEGTAWSDVVRFLDYTDTTGVSKGLLVFYSDMDDLLTGLPDALADTPHAPATLANWVQINEVGAGVGVVGRNGAAYTPLPGQPGYFVPAVGGPPVSYNFISDVPEPTTMLAGALLLLPFGASALRILRKTRKA